MPIKVLNPRLYARLKECFGSVQVACEGEPAMVQTARNIVTGRIDTTGDWGEYYKVDCPFCGDRRKRLWVNHRYGHCDATGRTLYWLAICYNERCLDSRQKRKAFEDAVFGEISQAEIARRFPVKHVEPEDEKVLKRVGLPGDIKPLIALPRDHKAIQYLEKRGYSIQELNDSWGIGWCERATTERYRLAARRLFIPIHMHGELVGWQARPPEDREYWGDEPKYYGLPGMPKRLMLYNYDWAKKSEVLVLAEGVTDVWALGWRSVALLGKTITPHQRKLIHDWIRGGGKWLVCMLDPDAQENVEGILEAFRGPLNGRVVNAALEGEKDPGELYRSFLWDVIRQRIRATEEKL